MNKVSKTFFTDESIWYTWKHLFKNLKLAAHCKVGMALWLVEMPNSCVLKYFFRQLESLNYA